MKIRNYEKDRQNTIKYSVGPNKYIKDFSMDFCRYISIYMIDYNL